MTSPHKPIVELNFVNEQRIINIFFETGETENGVF